MSGFRCYKVKWNDGTTYASSPDGVKACLQDIANKFLDGSDYHGFYLDSTNNPGGEPVKLKGSYGVYAICFNHRSGSHLMLALNYRGMSKTTNSGSYSPTLSDTTVDRCFGNKTTQMTGYPKYNNHVIGGLMACYIPVNENQETFDLTKDITDVNFFPDSAMNVVCTSMNKGSTSNASKTNTYGYYNYNLGQSLIPVGTNVNITVNAVASYGAKSDWLKSYSILCDDKETIILTSQCVNPTSINPPCRFVVTGKIHNDTIDRKGFSLQQHFYNLSNTRVGVVYSEYSSNYIFSEPDFYTEDYTVGSYLNSSSYSDEYNSSENSAYMMNCKESLLYPSPYPINNVISTTENNITKYGLFPICISGGKENIGGFISDNLRVMNYRSDLVHNTFFNNKEWCTLGYTMMFSGRTSMSSNVPSFTYNSVYSSYVWHLLFKYDEGNTDSPFVY